MRRAIAPKCHGFATAPRGMTSLLFLCLLTPMLALAATRAGATAPGPAERSPGCGPAGSPGAPLPAGEGSGAAAMPGGDRGWLARVQRGISQREYWASRNREGLQAPNRAHNLRVYFEGAGIRVHDRTAAGSPELLGLSLVGFGRGERLGPVEPGEVVSQRARVEIRRSALVEWYANSPAGLEQGFTLAERPDGEGALVLEIEVTEAQASLHRGGVIFAAPTGRRLSYARLAAVDAEGRPLAAHLELPDAGRLRIEVDDADATYPMTIDPLLTETADTQLESDQAGARLGISVAGAGDVNGDGYADVIVGAYLYDAGETNEGAAFLFLGSASGIADGDPGTAAAQLESDQDSAYLGISVGGAGDVDGDGYADVIVGAWGYDAGETDEGAAFVFLGSASGIADGDPGTAAAQLESDQEGAYLGISVAGAGDVDGDGYADVIAGAYSYDAGETDEGAAFLFLGNGDGDGRPVVARQRRGDGSGTPVQPWGGSHDEDAFEVRMQATHPEGRGRVKLEVEYCEAGLAFGDASCGTQTGASWTDVTATSGGVTLTETITGLSADTLYRWRARVLYASYSVTQSGITAPPNPAHGPWRRLSAQADEADIRMVPEPGAMLSLASGIALLAALHRRRRARLVRQERSA